MDCLLAAWDRHEHELLGYLRHRVHGAAEAEDLLQEVFLKALRQGQAFCAVDNARAWLFQVARNAVVDHLRGTKAHVALPDELANPESPVEAVDGLTHCLPRVLAELSAEDRVAITLCDIDGLTQQALAERLGLSLPGAKSRVQRARARLRERLIEACQVRFDETGRVCCFTPRPPRA
jgi:RNA polymerase sigma-70 factor (ECF subfamily)